MGTEETSGILVVDDQQDVRETLLMALPLFGFHRVFEAEDGQAAWALLQQHAEEIEVVVTDYRMPRMNGLELTRRIARSHRLPVAILLLTAFDEGNLKEEFLAAGSKSAIPVILVNKPYSIASLVTSVREAVLTVRARRDGTLQP